MRAIDSGVAFADLERIVVSPEARASISAELACELRALPFKRDGKMLWVAVESLSASIGSKLREVTGLRTVPVMVAATALDAASASV